MITLALDSFDTLTVPEVKQALVDYAAETGEKPERLVFDSEAYNAIDAMVLPAKQQEFWDSVKEDYVITITVRKCAHGCSSGNCDDKSCKYCPDYEPSI